MRVLHLSTWKTACGIADFTENIVTHLADRGVASEVIPLDVPAQRCMTSAEYCREISRFTTMAADFDLVHVQHEYGLFTGCHGGYDESNHNFGLVLAGLRAAKRPVIVTFHTAPVLPERVTLTSSLGDKLPGSSLPVRLLFKLRMIRATNQIHRDWRTQIASHFGAGPDRFQAVATTPWVRLGLIHSGFDETVVEHVPHGIMRRDPPSVRIGPKEAKARLGLPADSVLLTMFGFVSAYKGHVHAIQALKKLPPKFHLAVVGGAHPNFNDPTLNTVLEMWDGEDPSRLIVTGYASRETIDLYHAATDICLAPTQSEFKSASGSICWSLTSGKPTIASRIPVFSQIHAEGDCLLLCTPNAVHELAWLIQRLSNDQSLQRTLAQNALQFADRYRWDRVSDRIREIYCRMTGVDPATLVQPAAPRNTLRLAA